MQNNHFEKIQHAIADALYVDVEEVTRDSNLMRDLGAESIDFLDIMFRLEKEFLIKMPKGDIEKKARAGLSEEEFAPKGRLSEMGASNLKKLMPEISADEIREGISVREIPSLFTVATFERMVMEQLCNVKEIEFSKTIQDQTFAKVGNFS